MLLSTLPEYRVPDVYRLIMDEMDDDTLRNHLMTNKYNYELRHDKFFWLNRIYKARLTVLLGFVDYYNDLADFYFNIRDHGCYVINCEKERYDYMNVHFSSTIEGIIKYLKSRYLFDQYPRVPSNEPFEAMITLNCRGLRSGIVDILIDPNNLNDIDEYPVLNLHGFIFHDDGCFIRRVDKASVDEVFHIQEGEDHIVLHMDRTSIGEMSLQEEEDDYFGCFKENIHLTWVDHRPTKFPDQGDHLRMWQDIDKYYYLGKIYWHTVVDISPFENIYGAVCYPDLLIIIPVESQYKIALVKSSYIKEFKSFYGKRIAKLVPNGEFDRLSEIIKTFGIMFDLCDLDKAYMASTSGSLIDKY